MSIKKYINDIIVFFMFFTLHCLQIFVLPYVAGVPIPQLEYSLYDYIKNAIFYVLYWAFALYVVIGTVTPINRSLKCLAVLILLQIIISGIRWASTNSKIVVFFLVCDMSIPLQWTIACKTINKSCYASQEKRTSLFSALFISFLLVLSVVIDVRMAFNLEEMQRVFLPASNQLTTKTNNLLFFFNFKYAILDSVIASIVFSTYYPSEHFDRNKIIPRRLAQAAIILCVAALFYVTCVFLAPLNCIKAISVDNQNSINRDTLNCSTQVYQVQRIAETDSFGREPFCATRCIIYSGNEKQMAFIVDGVFPALTMTREDGITAVNDNFIKVSYNTSTIGLFCNNIMVIADGENVKAIDVKDILQQNENPDLIRFCRLLAEKQIFSIFPYYAKYLIKWDTEYITPILNDYSMMTDPSLIYEIEKNGVQHEYIKEEACKILGTQSGTSGTGDGGTGDGSLSQDEKPN